MIAPNPPFALALFSGGLDSILAARLIMEQGIAVHCLHFVTPFFGNAGEVNRWQALYGVNIQCMDISEAFVDMLRARPAHGFGKVMNPCVDCKILMMRTAREMMHSLGAAFIISGEVLGQRPMSQRRDTLNVIRREAQVRDHLLRPLSALHLDPTPMEESGLVDRSRLLGIFGRSRKDQLELAARFELAEIPAPAGGCRLAERENARRYWPVLTQALLGRDTVTAADFHVANIGRQFWTFTPAPAAAPLPASDTLPTPVAPLHSGMGHWLCVGRNQADNDALLAHVRPNDALLKVADLPGPLALARLAAQWDEAVLADAAAFVASFSPRAMAAHAAGQPVVVRVRMGETVRELPVVPSRQSPCNWGEDAWEIVRESIHGRAAPEGLV